MDDASGPGPMRDARGRFGPGNPGKPLGARNRMSRRVALALLTYFVKHQGEILKTMSAGHYLGVYARLLVPLLPKDRADDDPDFEGLGPEEAAGALRALRTAPDRVEAGQGGLGELQDALCGVAPAPQAPGGYGRNTVEAEAGAAPGPTRPGSPGKAGVVW